MAKVTRLGWGADGSNADDPDYFDTEEKKWAGIRSSRSSSKPAKKGSGKPQSAPSPAPSTGHPSSPVPKAVSSAGSAAGSPSDKLPPHPKGGIASKTAKGKGDK